MTFDLNRAIREEQKNERRSCPTSAQSIVRRYGYDKANALGFLDAYKAAWSIAFRLPRDEWANKWASKYPNTEYYKGDCADEN